MRAVEMIFHSSVLLALFISCRAVDTPTQKDIVVYNNDTFAYRDQDSYLLSFRSTRFSSGIYNLGFINYTTADSTTLGIMMNWDVNSNSTSRVIWEANRDDLVGWNAYLTFGRDGNLVLRDSDGRHVWSTNTANKGVVRIEFVGETGNLAAYDNASRVVWQSYDHPTDALVAGQVLQPGRKLVSRRSTRDPSHGYYSLAMEASGLMLYSNLSGYLEPYWMLSYYGLHDRYNLTRTCDSLVAAVLEVSDVSSLVLRLLPAGISAPSYARVAALCPLGDNEAEFHRFTLGNGGTLNYSFVRLEPDGNLVAHILGDLYRWDALRLFNDSQSCSLPGKCQPYGVCTDGQCSKCLEINQESNCIEPQKDLCNGQSEFLQLQGVEHFSSKYSGSMATSTTEEDCRKQCSQNCSCSAYFYWNETRSCFHSQNLLTLQNSSNGAHSAYVKISVAGTNNNRQRVVVAVSVSLTAAFVIAAGFVWWVLRNRRKTDSDDDEDEECLEVLDSLNELKPLRFTYEVLAQMTEGFTKTLGTGGFGGVYEGTLADGTKVAVKRLESRNQGKKEFNAEIAVLGAIHHWNLVRLVGFCADKSNRLLVYEYMANGSLDRWIFNPEMQVQLDWQKRMVILLGAARGLAYLHEECKQRILHLDIKPQNILLDEDFIPKVADFGLARLMTRDESFVVTTMRGTPGYFAPEWILEGAISAKSDVYSFGVVLLEILCGRKNFVRVSSDSTQCYLPSWALACSQQGKEVELFDPVLVDSIDESQARSMLRIAFLCIQEDPLLRPSMVKVVQMMESSASIPDPHDIKEGLAFAMKTQAQRVSAMSSVSFGVSSNGQTVT